jgi:hypothetical protein
MKNQKLTTYKNVEKEPFKLIPLLKNLTIFEVILNNLIFYVISKLIFMLILTKRLYNIF